MKARKRSSGTKPYPCLWKATVGQRKPLERASDSARWRTWHRGIINAPEFPSAERQKEQARRLTYIEVEYVAMETKAG